MKILITRASQSDGVRVRELFPTVTPESLEEGLERTNV